MSRAQSARPPLLYQSSIKLEWTMKFLWKDKQCRLELDLTQELWHPGFKSKNFFACENGQNLYTLLS